MSRKFINLATLQRLHTYAITDLKKNYIDFDLAF